LSRVGVVGANSPLHYRYHITLLTKLTPRRADTARPCVVMQSRCCQLVQSHTGVVYLRAAVSDEIMTLFADEAGFLIAHIVVPDQTKAGPQIQTALFSLPTRFLRCPVAVGHGTLFGAQFPIPIGFPARIDALTGRPQIRSPSCSPTRARPHCFCKQTIQEHEA